jgi:hypothetical protein
MRYQMKKEKVYVLLHKLMILRSPTFEKKGFVLDRNLINSGCSGP